jgi:hypothetical protein
VFIVLLVTGSSVIGAAATAWVVRPGSIRLAGVGRATLQFAGLWVLCLVLNLALGIAVVLAVRSLTPAFVSIYLVNDFSLVIVSGLQAFVLHAWIATARR